MSEEQKQPVQAELIFHERFWEQYVGQKLVSDPVTAIVELVANAWDAGAKHVDIEWPKEPGKLLEISDDGEGMTKQEFLRRWGGFSYDRTKEQPVIVSVAFGEEVRKRRVFGRNGIGRFAAFCFAPEYMVTTEKDGTSVTYIVRKGKRLPLEVQPVEEVETESTGTTIRIEHCTAMLIAENSVRIELGRRFLTDPAFEVFVNRRKIDFEDIEDKGLERLFAKVPGIESPITIKVIDAKRTDSTGKQHGVAWHVLGRLVGECDWKDPEQRNLIDGRRVEAKRFTFIVEADLLHESGAVKPDWSGFNEGNDTFKAVNTAVQSAITGKLLEVSREKRSETTANVRRSLSNQVQQLSPLKREKWNAFVDKVAEECPSLTESELRSVSGVLASMEFAQSKYSLLHKLHDLTPDQIDDLHDILDEWTVDVAKIVLDEIKQRMKLVEELRIRTCDPNTLEVQELQPLFYQGLWIFGPEYETIHFTSNQGMTKVIQECFPGTSIKGSRNRPDFAIVPDGSVGLYSYDEFDDEGAEIGPAKLVVLELKAPSEPIEHKHKEQCYMYVRELNAKGLLTPRTRVQGFVLGRFVDPLDRGEKTEMDGKVKILPLDFDTVLRRAESRLLRLRDKIKDAPFLRQYGIENFLDDAAPISDELPFDGESKIANS